MTDQAEALPQATSDEPTVSEVASKVDQILDFLKGGGQGDAGSESEPNTPVDTKAEMREQLRELKAEEDRKAAAKAAREKAEAAKEARLAAVEDKVKEKPPREYPKGIKGWFQRANGWGPDE